MEVKDVKTGSFDRKVWLLRQEVSRTATGAVEKRFVEDREMYARVKSAPDEVVSDGMVVNRGGVEMVTYLVGGFDTSWRVRVGDKQYEVTKVEEIARRYMCVSLSYSWKGGE